MAKKKFAGATGTVEVDVTGAATTYNQVLSCVDAQLPGDSRAVVDCQGMDEDEPDPRMGVTEQREASFLTHWDPSNTQDASLRTAKANKTLCNWKMELSDGTSTLTATFDGYVSGITPEAVGKDGRLVARVTIAVKGAYTEAVA